MSENIYSVLAARFLESPDATAFILPDGTKYTYSDIENETSRYANLLVSAGLTKGDRVAAQVDKSLTAIFLYLGTVRAGFVFVPMNPDNRLEDIEYFIENARPKIFVCKPSLVDFARSLNTSTVYDLDENGTGSITHAAAKMQTTFETVQSLGGDLAALMYTSGTTGRPKGAMLTHRNLVANTKVLSHYWAFDNNDVLVHMLPIFHTHGLFVATHLSLYSQSTILFEASFEPVRLQTLLPHATVFMGVPPYYVKLLNERNFDKKICSNMRLFVCGSAPLLPNTFKEFERRTGHTIVERYGMTEGGMLTSNPLRGQRRAGTVGFALPGSEIRVVDDSGMSVKTEEIGHVQFRGESLFCGYWQMPEKTLVEFTNDGFFRTGDVGRIDAYGYLSILGRLKDVIKVDGLSVYPREIESVIDDIAGVTESAVVGIPNSEYGTVMVAVVVPRRINDDSIAAKVRNYLTEHFPPYKIPKTIHVVDRLPRNTMGKVQKNALRQQFESII